MPHFAVLSSSVRTGRASHRVALFFEREIARRQLGTAEILDLHHYKFPIFDERLKYQPEPSADVMDFVSRIRKADGVIIVTPEYNGGYPAALKNVIDLLYEDWHRKPVAISTASDGNFGGTQVITSLQFTLWKIRAWTVPAMFPVPNVQKTFDDAGRLLEPSMQKRADAFLNELIWCTTARERMSG